MTIENWLEKTSKYYSELHKEIQSSGINKPSYYGYNVIDGAINHEPDILFVGINPGKGNGEVKAELQTARISYVDPLYPGDEYNYPLAKTTHEYLNNAGVPRDQLRDFLETKCVKTNFYHVATEQGSDVFPLLNSVEKGRAREYWKSCAEMLLELISIIKPKVVIFEGKEAYDHIVVSCCDAKNTWDKSSNMGYYFIEDKKTYCLGYARHFSNFKSDRAAFAKRLKELLGD